LSKSHKRRLRGRAQASSDHAVDLLLVRPGFVALRVRPAADAAAAAQDQAPHGCWKAPDPVMRSAWISWLLSRREELSHPTARDGPASQQGGNVDRLYEMTARGARRPRRGGLPGASAHGARRRSARLCFCLDRSALLPCAIAYFHHSAAARGVRHSARSERPQAALSSPRPDSFSRKPQSSCGDLRGERRRGLPKIAT
jgi:hypothetical protein